MIVILLVVAYWRDFALVSNFIIAHRSYIFRIVFFFSLGTSDAKALVTR